VHHPECTKDLSPFLRIERGIASGRTAVSFRSGGGTARVIVDRQWDAMLAQDFRIERPLPDTTVVVLTGEHDVATADRVQPLLEGLLTTNELLVVDLDEVEFLDSSVLNALIDVDRAASETPCTFLVQVGDEAVVRRVLEISGVLRLLQWAPTREGALARLGRDF
jgi:anti-anti-sigma factor